MLNDQCSIFNVQIMSTVTKESVGLLHEKINVTLSKEDYLPSFEKTLKDYAKKANIPGFRKGMVPMGMMRKMYGPSIFSDEVVRSAARKLEDYLKEEKLSIFAQPMIIHDEASPALDMNSPVDVDFSFEVGLKPEFEVPAIKNHAHLNRYKIVVSDKMMDDEIERI